MQGAIPNWVGPVSILLDSITRQQARAPHTNMEDLRELLTRNGFSGPPTPWSIKHTRICPPSNWPRERINPSHGKPGIRSVKRIVEYLEGIVPKVEEPEDVAQESLEELQSRLVELDEELNDARDADDYDKIEELEGERVRLWHKIKKVVFPNLTSANRDAGPNPRMGVRDCVCRTFNPLSTCTARVAAYTPGDGRGKPTYNESRFAVGSNCNDLISDGKPTSDVVEWLLLKRGGGFKVLKANKQSKKGPHQPSHGRRYESQAKQYACAKTPQIIVDKVKLARPGLPRWFALQEEVSKYVDPVYCLIETRKTETGEKCRKLLVDLVRAGRDGHKLIVWDVEPPHKELRGDGCCREVGAVEGAMRPGAPIRVLVDISGNPCTRPNGAKGRQSLPVSRLKIGFQPIPNRNDTILASHGFVPEIQLGPQVLPKCKFVNMLDAIYASVGMPASGNFTSGKEGRIKCPIPVAFSMGQILDLLFDRKTYHIASRTLANSKNKRDDPTQQLQCYQIIAKAHYDYLKNLWPDLDKFLDNGTVINPPKKRVFTKKWWDDHPDEEVKRNVRVDKEK